MKMHVYIQAIWNLALASKDLNHEKYKICREWHAKKIRRTTLMGLVFYRFFFGHCRVNAYIHLDLWPQVHKWFLASTSSTQRATLLNIYGAPAKYPTLLELVNTRIFHKHVNEVMYNIYIYINANIYIYINANIYICM